MIGMTSSESWALFLFAQESAESSSDEAVDLSQDLMIDVFEVAEPPTEHRIEISDDMREAIAPCSARPLSDVILEAFQALLTHLASSGLESITQKVEALSG